MNLFKHFIALQKHIGISNMNGNQKNVGSFHANKKNPPPPRKHQTLYIINLKKKTTTKPFKKTTTKTKEWKQYL
jgi:hypothetical protein